MSALAAQGHLLPRLTPAQEALVSAPLDGSPSLFLEGPAGAGKTTAAIARLLRLLQQGTPADRVLVLVPQRSLGRRYLEALRAPDAPSGALVDVLTIGGLAQRQVELYWPLIAAAAGFQPERPPTFLTLETAQYYMDRLIAPYLERGAFGDVTLARPRLISQILDDLNKAAVAGFSWQEIGARLAAAWKGESSRLRVYDQVQACAGEFRRYCLEHNLLDFSLQIETFARHVLALPQAVDALRVRYRYLLADNVEEDVPITHDLLSDWLPGADWAWIIYDEQGGLRTYLGADPVGAYALRERCRERARLSESHTAGSAGSGLALGIAISLGLEKRVSIPDPRPAVTLLHTTFHTDMVQTVASQIAALVRDGHTPPGQIAVLAPFMGDALRFALSNALEHAGIATASHRPSRSLRDEPAARCLLALAKLAHPAWQLRPARSDLAHALVSAIAEMDLVRAWHLTAIVYKPGREGLPLARFDQVRAEEQVRITYLLGNRYEELRRWLEAYIERPPLPLDHFLGRLFDEVLAQPGFGFRSEPDAPAITARLIASARQFRHTVGNDETTAAAFVGMVEQGVVAAQHLSADEALDAIYLAPAYTFVMANRPVDVQFWLDLGSGAWARRLYQPLTHPYVLTRHWPKGQPWTDADEDRANRQMLYRLVLALVRRCRSHIYLAASTYSERGQEEQGLLQQAIYRALRRAAQETAHV
ncbi:MAG: DEAD/DEAH box helicase [Anaerolineae bacterium]